MRIHEDLNPQPLLAYSNNISREAKTSANMNFCKRLSHNVNEKQKFSGNLRVGTGNNKNGRKSRNRIENKMSYLMAWLQPAVFSASSSRRN
jgi:hypothetical protein